MPTLILTLWGAQNKSEKVGGGGGVGGNLCTEEKIFFLGRLTGMQRRCEWSTKTIVDVRKQI